MRTLGDNPSGTLFQHEWCGHDAGQYLDIRFYYDDEVQAHVIYAGQFENGVATWDALALQELQKVGYTLPSEKVIPITRSLHYADKRKGA